MGRLPLKVAVILVILFLHISWYLQKHHLHFLCLCNWTHHRGLLCFRPVQMRHMHGQSWASNKRGFLLPSCTQPHSLQFKRQFSGGGNGEHLNFVKDDRRGNELSGTAGPLVLPLCSLCLSMGPSWQHHGLCQEKKNQALLESCSSEDCTPNVLYFS